MNTFLYGTPDWIHAGPFFFFKTQPSQLRVVFPLKIFFALPQCAALSPNKVFCPGTEQTAHLGGKQDEGRMPTQVYLLPGGPLTNRVGCHAEHMAGKLRLGGESSR